MSCIVSRRTAATWLHHRHQLLGVLGSLQRGREVETIARGDSPYRSLRGQRKRSRAFTISASGATLVWLGFSAVWNQRLGVGGLDRDRTGDLMNAIHLVTGYAVNRDTKVFSLKIRCSRNSTGGESGIRTHGRVSPTHAFQACSFNHSDISPFRINDLRAVWNSYRKTLLQILAFCNSV